MKLNQGIGKIMLSNNQIIGKYGELLVSLLPDAQLDNADNFNHPYDLLFEGFETNVKMAKLKRSKGNNSFSFKIHTGYLTSKFLFCIGYDIIDGFITPLGAWLIPSECITGKYLSIGLANRGKWKKYEYPMELINGALVKMKQIANLWEEMR